MWLNQLKQVWADKVSLNHPPLSRKRLLPLVQARTPLHHAQVPFILCWSQKSGCTAILKWFFYHAGLMDAALEYRKSNNKLQIHNYENDVFKSRDNYKQELVAAIIAGKPAIKFVRCPYQRLFSSYMQLNNVRFLLRKKSGQNTPGMKLRQGVIDFLHGEDADFESPIAFQGYLHWLKQQPPGTLDPHHAPQWTLLDEAIPLTYYRLEDFNQSVDILEQQFSLKKSSTVRNRFSSGHHLEKQQLSAQDALQFLYDAPALNEFSSVSLPVVTSDLLESTELAPLINELFEKDITLHKSLAVTV